MHRRALREAGVEGEYVPIGKSFDEFNIWLKGEVLTFDGFNVTIPYKTQVWDWIKNKVGGQFGDPDVDEMSAVNTVVIENGRPVGYNTDGRGFLFPLDHFQIDLSGMSVLLLGSGGAARAIAFALEKRGAGHLRIWNRTPHLSRAQNLAKGLNDRRGSSAFAVATDQIASLPVSDCTLLVNATSYGMRLDGRENPLIDPEKLHKGQIVYDIVYQPRETRLIQEARKRDCRRVITGDEMLAAQGAASFELFVKKPGIAAKVFPVMHGVLVEHYSKLAS